jgi:hypothetical protein
MNREIRRKKEGRTLSFYSYTQKAFIEHKGCPSLLPDIGNMGRSSRRFRF